MASESEILEFVQGAIRSLWNLELLLLLHATANRAWSPNEIIAELRASQRVVDEGLAALISAGLVVRLEPDRYEFAPTEHPHRDLVDGIAELYRRKPAAVIRAILSGPSDKIRTFADAFRFKR